MKIAFRNGDEYKEKLEKVRWLFYPYLARGHLTALASQTGRGKSYLASWWAVKLAENGKKVLYIDTYYDSLTQIRLNAFSNNYDNAILDIVKYKNIDELETKSLINLISNDYDVVVFDSFIGIIGDNKTQDYYLQQLKNAAVNSNAAILILFNSYGKNNELFVNCSNKVEALHTELFIAVLKLISYKNAVTKNLFCASKIIGEYNYLAMKFSSGKIKFMFQDGITYVEDIMPYSYVNLN